MRRTHGTKSNNKIKYGRKLTPSKICKLHSLACNQPESTNILVGNYFCRGADCLLSSLLFYFPGSFVSFDLNLFLWMYYLIIVCTSDFMREKYFKKILSILSKCSGLVFQQEGEIPDIEWWDYYIINKESWVFMFFQHL